MRLLILALAAWAVAGCSCPVPVKDTAICPPVAEWTQDQRNELADENDRLSNSPMIHRAITELAGLRAQLRACRAL